MLEKLDPSFRLLLAAIRWPSAKAAEAIGQIAMSTIDWRRFVALANRHRVEPLAFHTLSSSGQSIPRELQALFEEVCNRALFLEMRTVAEIHRLQQLLQSAAVVPVVLKGPAVSLRAFGRLGFRTYRDLDLLIPEQAIARAGEVLAAAGYERIEPSSTQPLEPDLSTWRKDHKDALFSHRSTGLLLELHWRLFDNRWVMREDARPAAVKLGLSPLEKVLILPAETEIEYLCIHGALHQWSRLRWLADINALIESVEDRQLAMMTKAVPAVAEALRLCQTLLGADLPSETKSVAAKSLRGKCLAKLAMREMVRSGPAELEAVKFGSTIKNLRHYALLVGMPSILEELRFDLSATPRLGFHGDRHSGRISDWMARHLLSR